MSEEGKPFWKHPAVQFAFGILVVITTLAAFQADIVDRLGPSEADLIRKDLSTLKAGQEALHEKIEGARRAAEDLAFRGVGQSDLYAELPSFGALAAIAMECERYPAKASAIRARIDLVQDSAQRGRLEAKLQVLNSRFSSDIRTVVYSLHLYASRKQENNIGSLEHDHVHQHSHSVDHDSRSLFGHRFMAMLLIERLLDAQQSVPSN